MSSTNRWGDRNVSDYYVTPHKPIKDFLDAFLKDEGIEDLFQLKILDPCAWGNPLITVEIPYESDRKKQEKELKKAYNTVTPTGAVYLCTQHENTMSYPTVLTEYGATNIATNDIREDSFAKHHTDFLNAKWQDYYDMIITNPPFFLATEIIQKSLELVKPWGYVIMLLRLNYFGWELRREFWKNNMPIRTYVHNKRIGFTPDGATDSIEYMHCVWKKWQNPNELSLKII